ncbi:uncharacterized protein LOC132614584 [Lycium barbarum]|uniref:uncharacterized protein LOC132614584 n=1 Tax=Lycium barbarum TaxID=112863 RepID=UPI00293F0FB8|nr:uncharacterized protein LOC132614584 [Lycium barbarum]
MMDSADTPDSGHRPPPPPPRTLLFISKFKPFYLLSILILILAISFTISQTDHYKKLFLRLTLSPNTTFLQKILHLVHPTTLNIHKQISRNPIYTTPYCVLWMAPFLSGGGYSSEAWSYILALNKKKDSIFKLKIEQHGDLENVEFWEGLPLEMRNLAIKLHQTQCRLNETVVICHSEPGAWYPPLFETLPCPPIGYGHFKAVIGRTMFETDRVNDEHVKRCNLLDFVWVPTDFHVKTFSESGVDPLKIVKIVQPVDLEFFDPVKYEPLELGSIGNLVMGSPSNVMKFVFLSIFKWEYRKGWDVLLKSYLKEFSGGDDVALYLLTNPYHSDRDFGNKIVEYVENSDLEEPKDGWGRVFVIDEHIAQVDMPRLYKAANAFVLPSRGEGWGRPIVEAMAMTLPVIATNWSGPTEFMTEENSYPLSVDRMSEVTEGPFKGHLWAEPSVDKLQMLMRHVMRNHDEAKGKGKQARYDMMSRFSPEVVTGIVSDHIERIIDHTQ